jgi:hypothetical protein
MGGEISVLNSTGQNQFSVSLGANTVCLKCRRERGKYAAFEVCTAVMFQIVVFSAVMQDANVSEGHVPPYPE